MRPHRVEMAELPSSRPQNISEATAGRLTEKTSLSNTGVNREPAREMFATTGFSSDILMPVEVNTHKPETWTLGFSPS